MTVFHKEKYVADWLGVSVFKLRRDRWLNEGIPYVKVGKNSVRYSDEAVEQYIVDNTVIPKIK